MAFVYISFLHVKVLQIYMQHEGCGKAAKVDENVAKWTKICRSTVNNLALREAFSSKFNCAGISAPKNGMIAISLTTYVVAFQRSVSDWRVSEWRFFSSVFFYSSTKASWPSEMWVKCNAKIYIEIQDLYIIYWQILVFADPLPEWFSLRDRFGADFPVLFPVAQGQRLGGLLRRDPGRPLWMANPGHGRRGLWIHRIILR